MAELYLKQKEKGSIIDIEAEEKKYLVTTATAAAAAASGSLEEEESTSSSSTMPKTPITTNNSKKNAGKKKVNASRGSWRQQHQQQQQQQQDGKGLIEAKSSVESGVQRVKGRGCGGGRGVEKRRGGKQHFYQSRYNREERRRTNAEAASDKVKPEL